MSGRRTRDDAAAVASDAVTEAIEAMDRTLRDAGATMQVLGLNPAGERLAEAYPGGPTSLVAVDHETGELALAPLAPHPDRTAKVPVDGEFAEDDDFLRDTALQETGQALIRHWPEFAFLRDGKADVRFVWKQKGGRTKGKDIYGNCQKTSGLLRHYSGADFIIWLAADHVRDSGFTNFQLEALLFHELKHAGFEIDDNEKSPTYGEMKLVVRGHDDEVFHDELRRYGAWNQQRQRTGEVYRQVQLPDGAR